MERFEAPVDIRRFLPGRPDRQAIRDRTDHHSVAAQAGAASIRSPPVSGRWRARKTDMDRKVDRLDSTVYNNFLGWNICMTRTTEWSFTGIQARGPAGFVELCGVKLELAQNYRDFRVQEICKFRQ